TNFLYAIRANFAHSHNDNDDKLYSTDSIDNTSTPPSAISIERMMLDRANSPYTSTYSNTGYGIVWLGYGSEPTAPGDSTLNPSFNIHFNLQYHHNHESYLLDKPEITRQRLSRSTDFMLPMVQMSFNSSNRIRNIFSYLFYQRTPSAPSLSYFVDNTNSSNPLDIYTGNPDGLDNSVNHIIGFGMGRYSRGATNSMFNLNGNWNIMTNSVAYAVRYNPQTGVSVHTPENISGNWSANLQASYSCSFGSRRQTTVNLSMSTDFTNSADYTAINATPVRSSVLSANYRPRVSLNYTLKNGSSLETGLTTAIGHQHSQRENFNNMTWYEYWPFIRAFLKLPADIELNTQFNPYFRRGYADDVMNTSEYVWNATLTKSFKRPAIALKLTAADILGSAKHVYTSVDAQGRVETWRQTMPRYVMLSVIYRLDMKPRKER
ncbi:MAG: outer membrane beta-barrel family protein, partial [Paramuribaculum sp.]|nr:outer membrane beta-barrel family protein [Paramuribaculum sp.]